MLTSGKVIKRARIDLAIKFMQKSVISLAHFFLTCIDLTANHNQGPSWLTSRFSALLT